MQHFESIVTSPDFGRIPGFFVDAREQLVDESIARAKTGGYTVYTTTLRAAWEAAIDSITDGLKIYHRNTPMNDTCIKADVDYRTDKRFVDLRRVAQYHRTLGITLQMYIGLFKMFRDVYTDHYDASLKPTPATPLASDIAPLRSRLNLFFDSAEISMMASWSVTGESERLRELQNKALSASLEKDKYLAIFESFRDPVFLLDHDRKLINANQMANVMFRANVSPGDIYFNRDQQHQTLQLVVEKSHAAIREQIVRRENPSVSPDSTEAFGTIWLDTLHGRRCFDLRERNIQDACDNKAVGYVVILHDITAHRQATEKAIKAEQVKSAFLATMSHEVRTPMHAILGATELLRLAHDNERDDYIDTIQTASHHLLETLTKVLDYSRLESGNQSINKTSNSVPKFVSELERFTAAWAKQAKRQLSINLHRDVPHELKFDSSSTRQIIHNLVANAIHYGKGHIHISITWVDNFRTGGRLQIDVSDEGNRLHSNQLTQIFEPYYRGDTEVCGTGLGLAICRHLAVAMDGSIEALKVAPAGTTLFKLLLPLSATEKYEQLKQDVKSKSDYTRIKRCMLIDDDAVSAGITADHLKLAGIHVDLFHTPSSALNALEQARSQSTSNRWNYFIVDYQLPEFNGAVVARRIRSLVHTQPVRIVAVTANTQLAEAKDRNAFDLIVNKPVSSGGLLDALIANPTAQLRPYQTQPDRHPFYILSAVSIQTVLHTFLQNWAERLPRFFSDLASLKDPDVVAQQAHRLASSASSVGLDELTEDLRTLERTLLSAPETCSGSYWHDRLETPMRRAPIKLRQIAESITAERSITKSGEVSHVD